MNQNPPPGGDNMIQPQPIDPDGKLVHFIEHDARIWRTLLQRVPPDGATVIYDLHVGTTPQFARKFPANYRRMIQQTARKRIDAILFFPTETLIIEIAPYAGLDSLGKALAYTQLFVREHPGYPSVKPTLLTDCAQPDMHGLCLHFNVLLIETDSLPTKD